MEETIYSTDSSCWTCGELYSSNSEKEFYNNNNNNNNTTSNTTTFTLSTTPTPIIPFEFDPCLQTTFPRFCNYNKDPNPFLRERNELSEVLISLKTSPHVGVTMGSGRMSPMSYSNSYNQQPPMFSPTGYSPNYCIDPAFGPNSCNPNGPNFGATFPSMSVNVSMNMTMGYLPPPDPGLQHQMQWSTGGPMDQGVNPQGPGGYYYGNSPTQNYCHQPYSATYNFAADFRPEPAIEVTSRPKWTPVSSPLTSTTSGLSSTSRVYNSTPTIKRQRFTRSSENTSPSPSRFGSKANLCRICGKTYARPSTLKTHMRTHSGEKPYRCTECHKSFSQAANLTAHVRTHSGEKPFRCLICDRKFSQSSSVTTHMRTHSGERPYRCRLCKKAFSDSSTLTKHLRIHSGEKPYQCKLCLLRFSQSGNLNRHMRVHSNNS